MISILRQTIGYLMKLGERLFVEIVNVLFKDKRMLKFGDLIIVFYALILIVK